MAVTAETALIFQTKDETIYDPVKIKSEISDPDSTEITVTNMASETLTNLGIYLRPTANVGPWDNPAESPPATDYQDIVMWGTKSEIDTDFDGGIRITVVDGYPIWITNTVGSFYTNRILIPNLVPSDSLTFKIEFVVPQKDTGSILDSRRLFVAVVVG